MTRTLKGSLLSASMLVVLWATTSEACHRRRAAAPATSYSSCYSSGYSYAGYNDAGSTGYYDAGGGYGTAGGGYYGGGYGGGTAGYPAHTGTTSVGPATTRAASAGRTPGWASAPAWASAHRVSVWAGAAAASAGRHPGSGCGPAWAPAAWAEGADPPQVLRSPCSGAPAWAYGARSGRHCGGQMMGERPVTARPTTVEEARTPTGAAGRHSGGAPAALLHRKWKSSMPESPECLPRRASEGRPSRGVAGDGHRSGDPLRVADRLP